ncbi:MAG TPA: hypothetical protein VN920_07370, partial [Pyrinomonadaceae bacterium]|nr:hypothetical protein [Pyrinomonadaceae bacterium]
SHDGRRDVVELRVEVHQSARPMDIEAAVQTNLRDRFADFWKNREMKLYELLVTAVPRGSLRRARKLQRVVDERQMLLPRPTLHREKNLRGSRDEEAKSCNDEYDEYAANIR